MFEFRISNLIRISSFVFRISAAPATRANISLCLRRRPFPSTPDASCYYPATAHEKALAALQLGLVNYVVTGAELERKTQEILDKLRELSAVALEMARRAMDLGAASFDSTLARVENLYLHELMRSEDAREGVKAFMEKRKAEWRHR